MQFVNKSDTISLNALSVACDEIEISQLQVTEILTYVNFFISILINLLANSLRSVAALEDPLPWIKFWAFLLASSAGSVLTTLELAIAILKDNDQVPTKPILKVFETLVESDEDISKKAVKVSEVKTFFNSKCVVFPSNC